MTREKKVVVSIVVIGYVTTWIFATSQARTSLQADTKAQYESLMLKERERKQSFVEDGWILESEFESVLRPNGPSSGINWSLPPAPCFLLTSDYSAIGYMGGGGHLSLYFWYGVGVIKLGEFDTWVS